MYKKTINIIAALLAIGLCTSANSVTLTVNGGMLTGAEDVLVSGSLYDVTFQNGTCVELYNGCDSADDFLFDSSNALNASQALLDQVLVDSHLGHFDSIPSLTNGMPSASIQGFIWTPTSIQSLPWGDFVNGWAVRNDIFEIYDTSNASFNQAPSFDTADSLSMTWAVWAPSASVPEPTSLLLLVMGLVGLGFSRMHKLNTCSLTATPQY